MHTIGTIREFRTARFRVIVDAIEENWPDLSWDETGEVAEGIESGRYVLFCARARVLHDELGEIAEDSLGNCIYESLQDFKEGGYFADMVHEVCRRARRELRRMRDEINGLTIREE